MSNYIRKIKIAIMVLIIAVITSSCNSSQSILPTASTASTFSTYSGKSTEYTDNTTTNYYPPDKKTDTKNSNTISVSYYPPVYSNLDFISKDIGYFCIGKNLLKSIDGGKSWEKVSSGKQLQLFFITDKIGYALEVFADQTYPLVNSYNSTLVTTNDGGVNWNLVKFFSDKLVFDFFAIDQSIFFVATGIYGSVHIYKTEDSGKSYSEINVPERFGPSGNALDKNEMSFVSDTEGYIIGYANVGAGSQLKVMYHTIDGGKNWEIQSQTDHWGGIENEKAIGNLPIGGYAYGIKFFENGTGYLNLARGGIFKTNDSGVTFNAQAFDGVYTNPLPCFINEQEAYVIRGDFYQEFNQTQESFKSNIYVYYSSDGAKTWQTISWLDDIMHSAKIPWIESISDGTNTTYKSIIK
ncbi:MAG: hypothetical protein FWC47_03765 [Oscillospiraceae bacterium]|nr:hypothetical protein [Oscillospiraceae bacterium]